MYNLIFTTLAIPGKSEQDTLLLVESLRSFGGELAANPIWVLVPTELGALSDPTQEKLAQLKARIVSFEIDPEFFKFPFAAKVLATAALETQAQGQTERLVFMDRDTIVLQEPAEFLIASGKTLGYRPVHHKLIGSSLGFGIELVLVVDLQSLQCTGRKPVPNGDPHRRTDSPIFQRRDFYYTA